MRARNASGTSAPSNDAIVSVGVPAGAAPSGFTATATGHLVTLTWSAPAGGAAVVGYQLHAGSVPDASDLAIADLGPTTTVTFPGVPAGTYYLRVLSVDALGPSASSDEIVLVVS